MPSISGWSQTAVETRPILLGRRSHLARPRDQLGAREAAHRQVVVAGPAEAAHARAAARDLDQVLHRHLGVRREHDRLREAHRARPAALPADATRAVVGRHGPVLRVAHLVAGRNVEAVLRLQLQEPLPRLARPEQRRHHPRHERLALAHRDEIGEGRERLGVQEHGGAAQDHERVARAAITRAQRDAGQAQHAQHVQVVVLERDREGDRVELPQRRAALEAHERPAAPLQLGRVLVVRQERPLAHARPASRSAAGRPPGSRGSTSRRSRGSARRGRRGTTRAATRSSSHTSSLRRVSWRSCSVGTTTTTIAVARRPALVKLTVGADTGGVPPTLAKTQPRAVRAARKQGWRLPP